MVIDQGDRSSWYAIHTHRREENRVFLNLHAWGIETCCPKLKNIRTHTFTDRAVSVIRHMFPCYVFARFDAETMLHKVRFTRGVRNVVSLGNVPARVDDEVIDLLRSRMSEDGLITLQEEFNDGDEVYLKAGPFNGFIGVFNSKMKDSDRVMILLTTVNFEGRLIIDKKMIAKRTPAVSTSCAKMLPKRTHASHIFSSRFEIY